MSVVSDFTADNLGLPDKYTVQSYCRKIRVREKDRDAATQAKFNVYFAGSAPYRSFSGGEEFIHDPGYVMSNPDKPFSIETVNVSAAVFSVIEEG